MRPEYQRYQVCDDNGNVLELGLCGNEVRIEALANFHDYVLRDFYLPVEKLIEVLEGLPKKKKRGSIMSPVLDLIAYLLTLFTIPGSMGRFSGTSTLDAGGGRHYEGLCFVEDLKHPDFTNRFHVLFFGGDPHKLHKLADEYPPSYNPTVVAARDRRMYVSWSIFELMCNPFELMIGESFLTPASETRWQRVTIEKIPFGLRFLIEEPANCFLLQEKHSGAEPAYHP